MRPEMNGQITLDVFHLDYRKMSSLRSFFFYFSIRNFLLLELATTTTGAVRIDHLVILS
jgi:hypothetical protein